MAKKKQKYTEDSSSLTNSPFGALAGLKNLASAPATDDPPAPKAEKKTKKDVPYRVRKTRKGNWPLRVEKRAAGKVVTLLENIEGDGKALLKQLKGMLGTGGQFKAGRIEIQGNHQEKLMKILSDNL